MKHKQLPPNQAHQPAVVRNGNMAARVGPQLANTSSLDAVDKNSERVDGISEFAAMVNAGPASIKQRRLADMINNSSTMAAQRKTIEKITKGVRAFGPQAQIGTPVHPFPQAIQRQAVVQLVSAYEKYGKPLDEMGREELNRTIDDTEIDERDRIEAEFHLKQVNKRSSSRITELTKEKQYKKALHEATILAGINPGLYKILPTDDYASVIPKDSEIPRGGTPCGVTVLENYEPVVYIHIEKIQEWALSGDIGNLLSTIRHEVRHAQQYHMDEMNQDIHVREFEAYAEEINSALKIAIADEKELLPSSAHIAESYESGVDHFNDMSELDQREYDGLLELMEENYKKLRGHLETNDFDSGRVQRISNKVRTTLKDYLDGKTSEYPRLAYNEFMKIPEHYRNKLKREFDPLFEQADEKQRNEYLRKH